MIAPIRKVRATYYQLLSGIERWFLKRFIANQFHRVFYDSGVDRQVFWLGTPVWKCPMDLWSYQEIICETRPDLIVECGTAFGGSALFFASICELLGHGRIITIDNQRRPGIPEHQRIEYVLGSSIDDSVVGHVKGLCHANGRVMVVLDSDHRKQHVLNELRIYSQLVTRGNYLVVEDTNINGHPVLPTFGPGPMEAVLEFLRERDDFVIDRSREKLMLTYHPKGFLQKI